MIFRIAATVVALACAFYAYWRFRSDLVREFHEDMKRFAFGAPSIAEFDRRNAWRLRQLDRNEMMAWHNLLKAPSELLRGAGQCEFLAWRAARRN